MRFLVLVAFIGTLSWGRYGTAPGMNTNMNMGVMNTGMVGAPQNAPYFYAPNDSMYTGVGELSSEAAIINCQCAIRINNGTSAFDPACANFARSYQNAIMTPGSVTQLAPLPQGPYQPNITLQH